jgi:hypothetical protein
MRAALTFAHARFALHALTFESTRLRLWPAGWIDLDASCLPLYGFSP